MIDAEAPRSDVEPAPPEPVAFGSERVIELPDGPLLQALGQYVSANPQAQSHMAGFLEGLGISNGRYNLEVTAARLVPAPTP